MEKSAYPFPLAVDSSHHSHYHRFLLGADPAVIAPFPKPYCVGALSAQMGRLAGDLNLPRWRKLYHASFPWVAGFGPEHYDIGNVAPHRPLPREYGRPPRRFGAYDFVQIADPSVSALALVAGDRRVLERFLKLGDDHCARIESWACSRNPGPAGSRHTGRMLAGLFAEPNNRWLMPFLHVHARVLNFTSFAESPETLQCIDAAPLARAAMEARRTWLARQAEALADLGYRASLCGGSSPTLRVEGVCGRLLAAIEAPRIAVLRMMERMILGERPPSAERLGAELPAPVIAAMAEQLEAALARSVARYKPAKIAIPSEGPWRAAVREHLGRLLPESLEALDAAAARARAGILDTALFPSPPLDAAHWHAPRIESFEAATQLSADPELFEAAPGRSEREAPSWLAREFESTLGEVNRRIARAGPEDPLWSLRSLLATIDGLCEGADPEQLRQSELLLGVEIERRARPGAAPDWSARPGRRDPASLVSLEQLFEEASTPRMACEHEIGGRCL